MSDFESEEEDKLDILSDSDSEEDSESEQPEDASVLYVRPRNFMCTASNKAFNRNSLQRTAQLAKKTLNVTASKDAINKWLGYSSSNPRKRTTYKNVMIERNDHQLP